MKHVGGAIVAIAVALSSPAAADGIADFYKGRTVSIIVGYPPASGYTIYAQLLAKYFADHVPGRPNVVVQNMPGAGGITAANYVYTVAPKDGTALGTFSVGALIDERPGNFDLGQCGHDGMHAYLDVYGPIGLYAPR